MDIWAVPEVLTAKFRPRLLSPELYLSVSNDRLVEKAINAHTTANGDVVESSRAALRL